MAGPSQPGQMPPPQPYPGMYYMPMAPEHFLTRRNVWIMNAFGMLLIWLGFLILIATTDTNFIAFARVIALTGGMLAALSSLAGALGSKRTSDMQNLGLLIFAGAMLVVGVSVAVAGVIRII